LWQLTLLEALARGRQGAMRKPQGGETPAFPGGGHQRVGVGGHTLKGGQRTARPTSMLCLKSVASPGVGVSTGIQDEQSITITINGRL